MLHIDENLCSQKIGSLTLASHHMTNLLEHVIAFSGLTWDFMWPTLVILRVHISTNWDELKFHFKQNTWSFCPAYMHWIYQATKFSFIHDMHCIICKRQLLYRCSSFAVFYGNQIHKLAVNVTSNNIDVSNLNWISSRYSFSTIFGALCYCLK